MQFFKTNRFPLAVGAILTLGIMLPAHAQQNLPAPTGWTKSAAGGDVVFSQPGSGCRFIVKKLTPLEGSLRSWFDAQAAKDARSRGQLVSNGAVTMKEPSLTVVRNFKSASGPQTVIYSGYAVGQQGRFLVVSGPSAMAVLKSLNSLNDLGQELGALDEAAMRGGAKGSTNTVKTPPVKTKSVGSSKALSKLSPVSAKGTLKSSQMLGVYLLESYTTGVGGGIIIQYDPVLLLRDGSARRDLEIPPLDVNLVSDKSAHAKDWGRWTRSGAKILVKWGKGDKDEIKANFKTRPARPGETLKREYTSIGGGGNTALGGDVMTFYSNSYLFSPDGRFGLKSSGGGSSSSVTALSNKKNGGRYRLDGHALTLKFNDGRQVRRLFYFYPNDNKSDVIGIGDDSYIGEK